MANDTKHFLIMWLAITAALAAVVGWKILDPERYPSQPRPGVTKKD